MPDKNNKVSFLYQRSKDHKTIAVNGAFGGSSPDSNTVIADLYVESIATPNIITTEIEGKKLKPETEERISKSDVIRDVQATLVMSPENAIALGNWLVQKGRIAKQNRSNND